MIEDKAARLIAEHRVWIREVGAGYVIAEVAGDTETYRVACDHDEWSCRCTAFANRLKCSHVLAVKGLVERPAWSVKGWAGRAKVVAS